MILKSLRKVMQMMIKVWYDDDDHLQLFMGSHILARE